MKFPLFQLKILIPTLLFVIIALLFLFGPLFPWSPVKPGYQKYAFDTYSVVYPHDFYIPNYHADLNLFIEEIEATLQLPQKKRISVIYAKRADLQRFVPWLKTDGLGGIVLLTGDVVYINYEKISEMGTSQEEYLKHELVHALHHQNFPIPKSHQAAKITYMSEGIPFYFGGPYFYAGDEWVYRLSKTELQASPSGDQPFTAESFQNLDTKIGEQYKVSHMLYGKFIGYLITTYGQEKFNDFNQDFHSNPTNHRQLFDQHFGEKLEVVVEKFVTEISQ